MKIEKAGLYNTNTFAHVNLKAVKDIVGKNGLDAILNHAGLEYLIDNMPPMDKEITFDFADYSSINMAIDEIYGTRGGRVLALRAGRDTFKEFLKYYGDMLHMKHLDESQIPLNAKISAGLNVTALAFNNVSDQECAIKELDDRFVFSVFKCPSCWGCKDVEAPMCYMHIGLLKETLRWLSNGKEFNVYEETCHAMGADACTSIIPKEPAG